MNKIVRTKTRAEGGITPDEKVRMDAIAKEWTGIAFRSEPIEADKIIQAIEGLYEVAGLKKPKVVIVPSPLVMAFAYGASAWILYCANAATRAATYDATDAATNAATYAATNAATRAATYAATNAATRAATYAATDAATNAATRAAADAATYDATYDATNDATYAATYDATDAATDAATRAATDAATDAATYAATRAATHAATYAATDAATNDATYAATRAATYAATDAATHAATHAATDAATYDATYAATYDATDAATNAATYAATDAAIAPVINGARSACFELAGKGGLECAKRWHNSYQGGNMWAAYPAYSAAMRDVLGLDLPEFKNYKFWEDAARHGGFRVMHQEFCIVSDFPVHIKVDENNLPHCVDGPSHLWRDGWALYHWHGQAIPEEWITKPGFLTAKIALEQENMDLRAAACEILGWDKIIDELGGKTIDKDEDEYVGELLSVDLPDAPGTLFLRARCGTGRMVVISVVDKKCKTALEANLGSYGLPIDRSFLPEART